MTLRLSLQGKYWFFTLIIFFTLLFPACRNDDDDDGNGNPIIEDPLKPKPEILTAIAGVVTDESGTPLAGVNVSAHGETAVTNGEGYFILEEVSVPANRCVISCGKDGFFTSIRGVVPVKDQTTQVRFMLMSNAVTHSIDAVAGGKAALNNGSEVDIPANGVVKASGEAYTGNVNMTVRYLDSSSPVFANLVPGGDMLARRTDESTSILYSYGILRVLLKSEDGEDLQIAPGKVSTLTVTIPESQRSTAPASIPLWFFDEEAGVWREEGSATREGDKYVGTVKHFTDWNCDDPKERATVIGEVVDCTGLPVITGEVFVGQSSSELGNGTSIDNSSGPGNKTGFQINVPANTPLFVMVPKPFTVIDIEGGDLVMVPVPPLKPGEVYDVGKIMPHPCPNSVSGKFRTAEGDKVQSVMFKVTDAGNNEGINGKTRFFYNPETTFVFSGFPSHATLSMMIVTTSGVVATKIFETQDAGEQVDIGEIDLTPGSSLITIHGVASCGNTPLKDAAVTVVWTGGATTVTTNSVGVFELSAPSNTNVVLTVEHAEGTLSKSFQSSSGATQNVGVINVCTTARGENSFILNGDGMVNVNHVLSIDDEDGAAVTFYTEEDNTTIISVLDRTETLSMVFQFIGHGVGEITPDKVMLATVGRKVEGTWRTYFGGQDLQAGAVSLNITRYEGPGGLVEGTFDGTFEMEGIPSVTITGKISATRAF